MKYLFLGLQVSPIYSPGFCVSTIHLLHLKVGSEVDIRGLTFRTGLSSNPSPQVPRLLSLRTTFFLPLRSGTFSSTDGRERVWTRPIVTTLRPFSTHGCERGRCLESS